MEEEASSSAQGSKIFIGKDGDALVFVLMPCSSKAAIRKLIEVNTVFIFILRDI